MGVQPEKKLFWKLIKSLFFFFRKLAEVLSSCSSASSSSSSSVTMGFLTSFRSTPPWPMSSISFNTCKKKGLVSRCKTVQVSAERMNRAPLWWECTWVAWRRWSFRGWRMVALVATWSLWEGFLSDWHPERKRYGSTLTAQQRVYHRFKRDVRYRKFPDTSKCSTLLHCSHLLKSFSVKMECHIHTQTIKKPN